MVVCEVVCVVAELSQYFSETSHVIVLVGVDDILLGHPEQPLAIVQELMYISNVHK